LSDFYADMQEREVSSNVLIFVFIEFGQRVKDNDSGTDHDSGGLAFAMGDGVKDGMYGEYPSFREADLLEGDLCLKPDFRGV